MLNVVHNKITCAFHREKKSAHKLALLVWCLQKYRLILYQVHWQQWQRHVALFCKLTHFFQTTKVVTTSNGVNMTYCPAFWPNSHSNFVIWKVWKSVHNPACTAFQGNVSYWRKKGTLKRCRRYPSSTFTEKLTQVPTASPQHYTCAKGTRFTCMELLLSLSSDFSCKLWTLSCFSPSKNNPFKVPHYSIKI